MLTDTNSTIGESAQHSLDRMVEAQHGVEFRTISSVQVRFLTWTVDVLTYVVILNLFTEIAPDHVSFDSFWITLLVAGLFRLLLSGMDAVKEFLKEHLKARGRPKLASFGVLPVFSIGKLVILEIVDEVFGQVTLNGFWYEWLLIFFLIVVPAIVWALFERLGRDA